MRRMGPTCGEAKRNRIDRRHCCFTAIFQVRAGVPGRRHVGVAGGPDVRGLQRRRPRPSLAPVKRGLITCGNLREQRKAPGYSSLAQPVRPGKAYIQVGQPCGGIGGLIKETGSVQFSGPSDSCQRSQHQSGRPAACRRCERCGVWELRSEFGPAPRAPFLMAWWTVPLRRPRPALVVKGSW